MNSHEGTKTRRELEELSALVVDCGYKLHVEAGPGLVKSVYEVVLVRIKVWNQIPPCLRVFV